MPAAPIVVSTVLFALSVQAVGLERDETAQHAMVDAVVESTTIEWRAAFTERGARYEPPRVVFLRPPAGHPARGAGYSKQLGIVVDLGDLDAVIETFPQEGPSLVALMVAHEVGHHVQRILGDDPEVTGAARELQADCLAGWWIVAAKDRASRLGVRAVWPTIDMKASLPQTLRLLDVLQSGRTDGGAINLETHGSIEARIGAFEQGMTSANPWMCLWGRNP